MSDINQHLDERVIVVNLNVSIMPDFMELFVNEHSYASAYRSAGQEALDNVTAIHAVALQALYGGWTIREMNQALYRLRISIEKSLTG